MGQPAVVLQNVIVLYTLGDGYLLRDRENISQVFVRNICQLFAVFYQRSISLALSQYSCQTEISHVLG